MCQSQLPEKKKFPALFHLFAICHSPPVCGQRPELPTHSLAKAKTKLFLSCFRRTSQTAPPPPGEKHGEYLERRGKWERLQMFLDPSLRPPSISHLPLFLLYSSPLPKSVPRYYRTLRGGATAEDMRGEPPLSLANLTSHACSAFALLGGGEVKNGRGRALLFLAMFHFASPISSFLSSPFEIYPSVSALSESPLLENETAFSSFDSWGRPGFCPTQYASWAHYRCIYVRCMAATDGGAKTNSEDRIMKKLGALPYHWLLRPDS